VIKSFRHAEIGKFFKTGSKAGIQPHHATKLADQLSALDAARKPFDMNEPSWRLHPNARQGKHCSVWFNGNYRLTFAFEGEDAILVDYRDYH
jgi:proteic killer suppression protein